MSTGTPLFIVQLNVDASIEDEWNKWYDAVHLPEVMAASPSIMRATRHRRTGGTGTYEYCAVYEFDSEQGLQEFMASDKLKKMSADYNATYSHVSSRVNYAYVPFKQIERKR